MPGLEKHEGHARSDVHCTSCGKTFVTLLDYGTDGYHRITCPYCGHIHWRKIVGGIITEDRADGLDSDGNEGPGRIDGLPIIDVTRASTWPTKRQDRYNSTASAFMRDLWLNRSDRS